MAESVANDDQQLHDAPEKPQPSREDDAPPALSRRKKLAFASVMASVPVVLALLLEAGLWIGGYESQVADPFASFVQKKPLFRPDPTGAALITDFPRSRFFHQQRFAQQKPAGTKRIFVFGGSTTYGYALPNPYEDSYVNQLGLRLEGEFPGAKIEMINCGGQSYASYRLVDLVEECVEYSPDLVIVMSGHNEFIEKRHYQSLIDPNPAASVWHRSKTARLVADVYSSFLGPVETSNLGNDPYVTEQYIVRDQEEFRLTLEHYTRNLEKMIAACQAEQVPIILCTCPSNLLDHPPFYTEPPAGMSKDEFDSRVAKRAETLIAGGRFDEALELANKILADDPDSAVCLYIAGQCHYRAGRMDEARKCLMLAKDKDDFPKRTLTTFNERVRVLATKHHLPLFDGEMEFLNRAADGLPGRELFYDDCHPKPQGHLMFAEGLKPLAAAALASEMK